MRIGIVAPPWVAVPPPGYGGTETIIDLVTRGLSDRGHDVRLFTTGDATCPVQRGHLVSHALGTERSGDLSLLRHHVSAAYRWLADQGPLDVIHDHTEWGPMWQSADIPIVATLHNAIDDTTRRRWLHYPENVTVVTISSAHRGYAALLPAEVIHHGIDTAQVPFGSGRSDHLLFLGRMTPDKGVLPAIEIARAAGLPLLIAARPTPRGTRVPRRTGHSALAARCVTWARRNRPKVAAAGVRSRVAQPDPVARTLRSGDGRGIGVGHSGHHDTLRGRSRDRDPRPHRLHLSDPSGGRRRQPRRDRTVAGTVPGCGRPPFRRRRDGDRLRIPLPARDSGEHPLAGSAPPPSGRTVRPAGALPGVRPATHAVTRPAATICADCSTRRPDPAALVPEPVGGPERRPQ